MAAGGGGSLSGGDLGKEGLDSSMLLAQAPSKKTRANGLPAQREGLRKKTIRSQSAIRTQGGRIS